MIKRGAVGSEADNCSDVSRGAAVADGVAGRIGGGEDTALGMLGAVQTDKTAGLGRLGGKHLGERHLPLWTACCSGRCRKA